MEPSWEPIATRTMRLENVVSGPSFVAAPSANRELLFDAVSLLFDQCNNDCLKNDPLVAEFVNKFKITIPELKTLRINRFDFHSKRIIGRGHFGDVELVVENHTKNYFAMKVLKKNSLLQNRDTAFFEHERDIMASSSSPFLTQLRYAFQDFQNLYLIMDYHPGGDFANLITKFKGKLSEKMARFYIAELLLAVKHLHAMGFAHRDIKPDNMMLDSVGHLKLVDFGSAAKLDRDGKINACMPIGSSEYLAPEILLFMQSNSMNGYGPQCDLWSVGIVAYEMVFGFTPFSSEQKAVIYSNILNYKNILKYPTSSKVSISYRQMIECLVCHVDKRFTVGRALALETFSTINCKSLPNQVSPYIPSILSDDDVSNFPVLKPICPVLNINDFKTQKQFSGRDLPFIGFSYSGYVSKRNHSCFTTKAPALEKSVQIKVKELEDARVKMQANEDKIAKYNRLLTENERKNEAIEQENVLLRGDLSSLRSEFERLTAKLNETSVAHREEIAKIKRKHMKIMEDEIDKWNIESVNKTQHIEQLKRLNDELQSKLSRNQDECKDHRTNEEQLNETIMNLKSKLKVLVQHSKSGENDDDSRIAMIMSEIELKEDAFEVEKNQLSTENQCLKKKIVTMEKDIDNLNSKIIECTEKESILAVEHEKIIFDYESKLNVLNQEKDDEIKQLNAKISQMEYQLSDSVISFEKNEITISAKEMEKELRSELKSQKEKIHNLKLDIKTLQEQQKTIEETEYHDDAQDNLNQEVVKIQEKCSLQIEKKEEEMELVHHKITNLNQTMESLRLKLLKVKAQQLRLGNELSKIVNESKIWTSDKSVLEKQMLEYEFKCHDNEANVKKLKSILTVQDKQLLEFEETIFSLKMKEEQSIKELKIRQEEIDEVQNELLESRQMYNEEKSLGLLAESENKTVEITRHNDLKPLIDRVRDRNVETDNLRNQLGEVNLDLRETNTMLYNLKIEYEKVVKELHKMKIEITEILTQKQLLKDANVQLKSQLDSAVEDSNVLQNVIYKYQNSLMEQKVNHEEFSIKTDATILQNTKLIEFLQTKLDDMMKKRSLGDMFFNSKTKGKDTSTPLTPVGLNSEAVSPAHKSTLVKPPSQPPIFHSFKITVCKLNGFKCSHCKTEITRGKQISQCQECRVSTHVRCSHELLPDCTLLNKKENCARPALDVDQKSSKIESWVTMWDNTEHIWDRKYATFDRGVLRILDNKHDVQPVFTLPFSATLNTVKIADVAKSNDSIFDKDTNEDYEQMLKIEVYSLNSGWMTRTVYMIASSIIEKHNWLKVMKTYLDSVQTDALSHKIPDYQHVIYRFGRDEIINVQCIHRISQSIFLLGADEGMYSVQIKTFNGQTKHDLVPILGPKLVKDFVFLPELKLVLIIAGNAKVLLKCDMRTILMNAELSPTSKPVIEVIRITDDSHNHNDLKEVNCIAASRSNELVVVGSERNITVLKWQETRFVVAKVLKTNVSTNCFCFVPTGIVFTTNSFYIIDTVGFNCKRFFTDIVAKLNRLQPMFICELTKNKEYILCYNKYGVFVDQNGNKTRSGVIKWTCSPKSFAFKRPFLIIVSENEVSVIKITQHCCVDENTSSIASSNQPKDQEVLRMNRPTLLSGNNVYLKNDHQGTCSVFQLDPSKVIKNSMASVDTQDTSDDSESDRMSLALESLD